MQEKLRKKCQHEFQEVSTSPDFRYLRRFSVIFGLCRPQAASGDRIARGSTVAEWAEIIQCFNPLQQADPLLRISSLQLRSEIEYHASQAVRTTEVRI